MYKVFKYLIGADNKNKNDDKKQWQASNSNSELSQGIEDVPGFV